MMIILAVVVGGNDDWLWWLTIMIVVVKDVDSWLWWKAEWLKCVLKGELNLLASIWMIKIQTYNKCIEIILVS